MIQASVFLNNRTQAVRLPKAVALDDDVRQVTVVAAPMASPNSPTCGHPKFPQARLAGL